MATRRGPCAIIHSASADGTILYISPDVTPILATARVKPGMPYRAFLDGLRLGPEHFASLETSMRLDRERIEKKLEHLTLYCLLEQRDVFCKGAVSTEIGVAFLPVSTGGEQASVCRIVITKIELPDYGVVGLTLLYDDVPHVSVEQILAMAGTGEFFEFMRRERSVAHSESFRRQLDVHGQQAAMSQMRRVGSCQTPDGQDGQPVPKSSTDDHEALRAADGDDHHHLARAGDGPPEGES